MALIKSVETASGVNAEYWKIVDKSESYLDNFVKVTLGGYATKALRLAGKGTQTSKDVVISGVAYTAEMDRAALYTAVKATDEWSTATDDV